MDNFRQNPRVGQGESTVRSPNRHLNISQEHRGVAEVVWFLRFLPAKRGWEDKSHGMTLNGLTQLSHMLRGERRFWVRKLFHWRT